MAKKTVASLQKGEGRTYSKVIKMVKSPKTGAYIFEEEMVPNEKVNDKLEKYIKLNIHSIRGCRYIKRPAATFVISAQTKE